jgi:hypothetical protein
MPVFLLVGRTFDVGVGSEGYTKDWAVIEVDASKADATNSSAKTYRYQCPKDRRFKRHQ